MCGLIDLLILYHHSSDLTHNLLNICNWIPSNVLVMVLELTFSCSLKNVLVALKWSSAGLVSGWTYMKAYMWPWSRWKLLNLFSCAYLYIILIVLSMVFISVTFLWFACKNLQHIFPPIYDNAFFFFNSFLNLNIWLL